jgi:SAM-dependent methyltransferase
MQAEKQQSKANSIASSVDKYEIYEAAVQNVAEQCSFIDHIYRTLKGRNASSLREDFCGSASAACEWVRLRKSNTAIGVDLDANVIEWGRRHRMAQLTEKQRARVSIIEANVMDVETSQVDVIGAFNFSYWIFAERKQLLAYFKSVYASLNKDGVFLLDAFGGYEAFKEQKEKTRIDDFTYIWDQASYCPVTGIMKTHIHFKFPDGSKLKKAFTYEWRLWTLPEIKELLTEAGFKHPQIYFEYLDDDGTGLGEWYSAATYAADPAWVANISAEK